MFCIFVKSQDKNIPTFKNYHHNSLESFMNSNDKQAYCPTGKYSSRLTLPVDFIS